MSMSDYIYAASLESGLIKIGITSNTDKRMIELCRH